MCRAMSWQTDFTFKVDPKPKAEVFAPTGGWGQEIPPVSPWAIHAKATPAPAYQSDENLKKQFGIELAKSTNPFEAGCKVFGEETNKALWASAYWINDAIVIASRDIYLKTVSLNTPILDKEQLAAKVLILAEGEKILKNGVLVPTIEAKDRYNFFKLYSEIAGYTGKVEIDNSKTFNAINEMTIKLVKAEDKKPTIINNAPNVKSEMVNPNSTAIQLKLVGGTR